MDDRSYQYFEAQIMTATPQKLRLLLIEGAIRTAHQTLEYWELDQPEKAVQSLIQCRAILRELLAGINVEQSELTRRVASVYLFLLRCMTDAQINRDRQRVQETISVLEVERETWRLVCEKMPTAPIPTNQLAESIGVPVEIIAPAEGIGGPDQSAYSFDA